MYEFRGTALGLNQISKTYTSRINIGIVFVLRKIGNRPGACEYKGGVAGQGIYQYGAQIKKKLKKTRGVSGPLHGRFSAKKQVYGRLRDAVKHSHMKSSKNAVWALKLGLAI